MQNLQPGTTLQSGKYRILSTLGHGGFGITYLAEHTLFDYKVTIFDSPKHTVYSLGLRLCLAE